MPNSPPPHRNLWVITTFFNPFGYQRRLPNYRVFRARLAAPLLAVELSFGEPFSLGPEDAEVLIQLRGADLLWQKERLLNLAIQELPEDCDAVAWVDCDVVFDSADWRVRAQRALDDFPLVQLYRQRHELPRDALPESGLEPYHKADSVGYKLAVGTIAPDDIRMAGSLLARKSSVGLAWAGRRENLAAHGLYDACVLGSGDRAIVSAAIGRPEYAVQYLQMNERRQAHYRRWAEPFFESMRGQLGYVEGVVFHLWHGELADRRYATRHQEFEAFDFDPFTDIALAENGCWRWNTDKPSLHEHVRGYLQSRKEE